MWPPPVSVAFAPSYDGRLRISVALGPWQNDYDGKQLTELVEGLLLLCDRGAFVRAAAHPIDASAQVIGTRHAPPSLYIWDVAVAGVDHRFSQIFRNQMAMFAGVFCPVQHATIEMLDGAHPPRPVPLPDIDPVGVGQGHVYPGRSTQLRFAVSEQEVGDYAQNRRAEVEFVNEIDDATLAVLRSWFHQWAELLDCAYPGAESALEKGRCAFWDHRTDILDVITLETSVGYWGAVENAWDGYVNLVGRVDAQIARVRELRLY
jgi:hypothetical protein